METRRQTLPHRPPSSFSLYHSLTLTLAAAHQNHPHPLHTHRRSHFLSLTLAVRRPHTHPPSFAKMVPTSDSSPRSNHQIVLSRPTLVKETEPSSRLESRRPSPRRDADHPSSYPDAVFGSAIEVILNNAIWFC
ncbi:hypothetical protein PIB30_014295 [Stylosanthes scabra]|uniref:Uncharacterized protein n=1 Tax=Stylosanthes scabra TaxID=79078 RepID=A0ABU6V6B1_9FABA|nr:hypothetical protein [Stylosanthes scabra]